MPFLRKETQACNTNILEICYRFLKKIANPLFHVITFDDVSDLRNTPPNKRRYFLLVERIPCRGKICMRDWILQGVFKTLFQASEEYREHSTHKTHRAKKTRQKQEQHVVKQHSSTVQESSSVSTRKNFNEVRLNNILLPLLDGTVTCK